MRGKDFNKTGSKDDSKQVIKGVSNKIKKHGDANLILPQLKSQG